MAMVWIDIEATYTPDDQKETKTFVQELFGLQNRLLVEAEKKRKIELETLIATRLEIEI